MCGPADLSFRSPHSTAGTNQRRGGGMAAFTDGVRAAAQGQRLGPGIAVLPVYEKRIQPSYFNHTGRRPIQASSWEWRLKRSGRIRRRLGKAQYRESRRALAPGRAEDYVRRRGFSKPGVYRPLAVSHVIPSPGSCRASRSPGERRSR